MCLEESILQQSVCQMVCEQFTAENMFSKKKKKLNYGLKIYMFVFALIPKRQDNGPLVLSRNALM